MGGKNGIMKIKSLSSPKLEITGQGLVRSPKQEELKTETHGGLSLEVSLW